MVAGKLAVDQFSVNWNAFKDVVFAFKDAVFTYGVYPLMLFGVVGFVAIYIWVNSLKYRKANLGA